MIAIEASRQLNWPAAARWSLIALVLAAALATGALAARRLLLLQQRARRQQQELAGLHLAGLASLRDDGLEAVLRTILEQARAVLTASYGALSVFDDQDRIAQFETSGVSVDQQQQIGPPPTGRGLLGLVLRDGQHLCLADLSTHPRSSGFPPNHPQMRSLLAVPVDCIGPHRGMIYLADPAAGRFSPADLDALRHFATQAAIAIDSVHVKQRTRELASAHERLRIAHEIHDGQAQILAYVNTKAQAVREYLRQNRTAEAQTQLEQLAVAARQVYADVRSKILDLRTAAQADRTFTNTLQDLVAQWTTDTSVAVELKVEAELELEPKLELQLLRIVQEALTNVRKHAGARQVRLELKTEPSALCLRVADDGAGFDPEQLPPGIAPRFGLMTMRERAASAGGHLTVISSPGRGTEVRATLPLATAPTASSHRRAT